MTLTDCETGLLRRLAEGPFADRLDLAALSGWSRGAVYAGMDRLQERGWLTPSPTLHRCCRPPRDITSLPTVCDAWRRSREPPLRTCYAAGLFPASGGAFCWNGWTPWPSSTAWPPPCPTWPSPPASGCSGPRGGRRNRPPRWTHYRRAAPGTHRRPHRLSKRLWRLREGPLPGGVLVLAPDEVRLRHARRMLAGARFPVYLALEKDAALAGLDSRCGIPLSSPPAWTCAMCCPTWTGAAGCRWRPSLRVWPCLPTSTSTHPPRTGCCPPCSVPPRNAPWTCSPIAWASRLDLAGLIGVSTRRVSQLTERLEEFGLLSQANAQGTRRLALSDRALALLARRDRASVGTARRRLERCAPGPEAPLTWRNVSGSRAASCSATSNTPAQCTGSSALCRDRPAPPVGRWCSSIRPAGPPATSATRHFALGKARRLRRLRRGDETVPFFLEWERRAVRPVTMAARLAPYLRYSSSSRRPLDDHGVLPVVLVVFDDDLAATHFLRVAGMRWSGAGVEVPLWVSHRAALERLGPLGRAWQTPATREALHSFSAPNQSVLQG